MDPGNWATDIAGGAKFGYTLLSVIMLSNLMAILLQSLSARLGIASGRDLAQACRDAYSRRTTFVLWILCEIAIAACDLAEVLGAAIALQLLFGIPLLWGVCLTATDVFLVLYLQNRGFRYVEAIVVTLILGIAGCFAIELWMARPDAAALAAGPHSARRDSPQSRDALHLDRHPRRDGHAPQPVSALVDRADAQVRRLVRGQERSDSLRDDRLDRRADVGAVHQRAPFSSWRRPCSIPTRNTVEVADIGDAYLLLDPLLGATVASTLFAVALLFSGQNATLTGTLAGQIVMEGFLNIRLRPWLRRLITRLIAIVPAVIVIAI